MLRFMVVIVVIVSVSACERAADVADKPSASDATAVEVEVPVEQADSSAQPGDATTGAGEGNAEAGNAQTKTPLNLSLPADDGLGADDQLEYMETPLLPDMFEKPKKDKKLSVSGKLLNNPDEDDPIEAIDGAEISVEVKTR